MNGPSANRAVESHLESAEREPAGRDPVLMQQRRAEVAQWPWIGASGGNLLQGLIFGLIFGFLLQKGGVANFDILIGVLLLENFVVVKVMLTAIIIGMVGVYALELIGLLKRQIKETVYGTNVLGGLLFGVGFGLLAYCPGTNAAAVGQGNLDALVGVAGMICGSYLFALTSDAVSRTVGAWGRRGESTLPGAIGIPRVVFIFLALPVLAIVLVLLEVYSN